MGAKFKPSVTRRTLPWGSIIFDDAHHVTVETPTAVTIFHRYGTPRGFYQSSWRLFLRVLHTHPLNNIYDIHRYAEHYEVEYYVKENKFKRGDNNGQTAN